MGQAFYCSRSWPRKARLTDCRQLLESHVVNLRTARDVYWRARNRSKFIERIWHKKTLQMNLTGRGTVGKQESAVGSWRERRMCNGVLNGERDFQLYITKRVSDSYRFSWDKHVVAWTGVCRRKETGTLESSQITKLSEMPISCLLFRLRAVFLEILVQMQNAPLLR